MRIGAIGGVALFWYDELSLLDVEVGVDAVSGDIARQSELVNLWRLLAEQVHEIDVTAVRLDLE
mgnify:CR=1 FL=1